MKTIALKSRIDARGMLNVRVPTGEREGDVEVLIVLQPGTTQKKSWPRDFLKTTFGLFKDDPISRPPQGAYPDRELLR